MKISLRQIFLSFTLAVLIIIATLYGCFLFVLPKAANSKIVKSKIINFVYKKTSLKITEDGLILKTYPDLKFDLDAKNIRANYKNSLTPAFTVKNLCFAGSIGTLEAETLTLDYMYINIPELSKVKFKPKKESKQTEYDNNKIPYINIKHAIIIVEDNKTTKSAIDIARINIIPDELAHHFVIDTKLKYKTNQQIPPIEIRGNGRIFYDGKTLDAKWFDLATGIANFHIDGLIYDHKKKSDFNVKAENISVAVLKEVFLTIIKRVDPNKNFIENFYNFGGTANVNLKISDKGIFGTIPIKNLSAKTVKFDIPIMFPHALFTFDGDKVRAKEYGTFGGEKVFTDFYADDMFENHRLVHGTVSADVGSKFAKTYIPDTDILNKIGLKVEYKIQYRKPAVEYFANIPIGANIFYKTADKKRKIYAKTIKIDNNMYLDTYNYSFENGASNNTILEGDGLFVRKNNKFSMRYITGKTKGRAPVSVTGSFGRYVSGGTFSGNLKYNAVTEKLTGNFHVYDTRYQKFHVHEASVIADDNTMVIKAKGTFDRAKFYGYINLVNSFIDRVTIKDIELYLERFVLKQNNKKRRRMNTDFIEQTKSIIWTIERGKIILDKFVFNKVIMENIVLSGSLKNNLVKFDMPDISFAGGKLGASGDYKIYKNDADIHFYAHNIDSNKAASMTLNLDNQVEGLADVDAHFITQNKIEKLNANVKFAIKQGAMTKLGSREFMIKNSKDSKKIYKFKLPDIINIDAKKLTALKADIDGSFNVVNADLKDINIFSKHRYLSIFTEGCYNIDNQNAKITVWGKFNRDAQRGIRIYAIPLSWITKIILRPEKTKHIYTQEIKKIPDIEATENQTEIFKVTVFGNMNDSSKIKYDLKRLK